MAEFQESFEQLKEQSVAVLAFSVDPLESAQELVDELELTFPVAYGIDYLAFARATGAFYETRRSIIHAT